jgi:1-phosphofructokinase family hexose kinase
MLRSRCRWVSGLARQHKDSKLFLCVSLNPAIDKRLTVYRLEPGRVNRAVTTKAAPGGKSTHVAMVLQVLGANVVWTGFHGGAEGAVLIEGLQDLGIRTRGVPISGRTRTNLEILEDDGAVTELLEPGPTVTPTEIMNLQNECEELLRDTDQPGALILSGSLPPGAPADCYARLTQLGHRYGTKVFLDASGEPLRRALEARPDFVKVNQSEGSEVTGIHVQDLHEAGLAVERILGAGARSAAISLGAEGLAFQADATLPAIYAPAPRVNVTSAVGSGDAALAGFAFACSAGLDNVATLQLAVACGAANCLAELPGRPRKFDIERLRECVVVGPLESLAKGRDPRSC